MGFFNERCSKCGFKVKKTSSFCSNCGILSPSEASKCTNCGTKVGMDSSFCWNCGWDLEENRKPILTGNRWARRSDDFASKIKVDDLPGTFKKEIVIEEGTKALFFLAGRLAGELGPGKYPVGGLFQKVPGLGSAKEATLLFVDTSDVPVDFEVLGVRTVDNIKTNINCRLLIQLAKPSLFFSNLMKYRWSYTTQKLRADLYDEVKSVVSGILTKKKIQEILSDILGTKKNLEQAIEYHMNQTFSRNGLSFVQIATFEPYAEKYEQIRDLWEEASLAEKRNEVRHQLSEAKLEELEDESVFERKVNQINREKLIRDNEIDSLRETFRLQKELLPRKIELEQNIEWKRMRLLGDENIDSELLDVKLGIQRKQFEETLWQGRAQELQRLELEKKERIQERESDEDDAQLGLRLLKDMKEIKLWQKEREYAIELEHQAKTLRIQLEEKERRLDMELRRAKAFSELSSEALIAASDSDKAKILVELKRTEMLKDFSSEQILAMAADKHPQVAAAFQEKYRATGVSSQEEQQKMQQLYERMLSEKNQSQKDFMQAMKEMFTKSLETQRDLGMAAASAHKETSSSGEAPGKEKVILCPHCHRQVSVDDQFCRHCKYQLIPDSK